MNDESRGTCNLNNQIKIKTTMPKSSLCDYSAAHILAKGTITVNNTTAALKIVFQLLIARVKLIIHK